jgi:hypothetical protein
MLELWAPLSTYFEILHWPRLSFCMYIMLVQSSGDSIELLCICNAKTCINNNFSYQANEIEHLVIPTRDYLFAPSFEDISQAIDFIHRKFLPFLVYF